MSDLTPEELAFLIKIGQIEAPTTNKTFKALFVNDSSSVAFDIKAVVAAVAITILTPQIIACR